MDKKLVMPVFVMLMLFASKSWAGTSGDGWAGPPKDTSPKYVFCYAGNVNVVYLSQIMTMDPTMRAPKLAADFEDYVHTAYGLPGADRLRCVIGNSKATVAASKQTYLSMFGKASLNQVEWTGH